MSIIALSVVNAAVIPEIHVKIADGMRRIIFPTLSALFDFYDKIIQKVSEDLNTSTPRKRIRPQGKLSHCP